MFCQRCGAPTEERNVDGRERPVCTGCGAVTYLDPKLAVTVVIERGGRVLLGKRAAWTRSLGAWSFPAGFVERGEVVESAAIREVGESVVLLVYPATSFTGTPVAGDDLTDLEWFSSPDLPDLAFPHDTAILQLWRSWRGPRAIT